MTIQEISASFGALTDKELAAHAMTMALELLDEGIATEVASAKEEIFYQAALLRALSARLLGQGGK